MANGKILIEYEKRPCMIMMSGKEQKALFHSWADRAELVGGSPLMGGHPAGQLRTTVGIVELEDGTVTEVYPNQIRFLDKKIQEYFWGED